jgi:hypothetical protein
MDRRKESLAAQRKISPFNKIKELQLRLFTKRLINFSSISSSRITLVFNRLIFRESWIFVRLFYKYRRQSMSKSSREMEKKSWTNIETKGSTTPTAEDKNTKNVSCGSHFLMNMTLSEFL